jgi:hypothetical protein
MSFEDDLEYLRYVYLRFPGHSKINSLLYVLGCHTLEAGTHSFYTYRSTPPAEVHDAIVNDAFRELLRWYSECGMAHEDSFVSLDEANGFSIVTGLLAKSRWRDCIASVDGAHQLAVLLVHLTDATDRVTSGSTLYQQALKAAVSPVVCTLANEWLRPEPPFGPSISVQQLTQALFGDAWCDMVLVNGRTAPRQIYRDRPPFMPNVPVFKQTEAVPLPSLEGS